MTVAGAGSHTLEDAPISVPHLPTPPLAQQPPAQPPQCSSSCALHCPASAIAHTWAFPFVLKCQCIHFISYCPFLGIWESEARSFFHWVQLSEFWVQLLQHMLPSLLPSHKHSPKFPSLFVPGISSSWRFWMLSSLLHHFRLAMAPHLSPNTEGTTKESDSFPAYLPSSHPDKMSKKWKTTSSQFYKQRKWTRIYCYRVRMLTLPAPKMIIWIV